MPDGSIIFSTALDNAQLEKDLAKLKKDIEKTEKTIAELTNKREEAAKTSVFKGAELDAEKAKLQEIRDRLQEIRALSRNKSLSADSRAAYAGMIPGAQTELADQQTRVRALQAEYNKIDNSVLRYDQKLKDANATLDEQKARAGELTKQIAAAGGATSKMGDAISKASKRMDKFINRVKRLASCVFVFTLITSALQGLKTWLGNVIKSNDEATAAIAKLKGALLTLAQPLVNVIIPAFTILVNILAKVISVIASFVSMLFGTTASASADAAKELYNEMNAIEGVGEAAEEAAGSLAGFDEINQLSNESASGAGGGASASGIMPDFSEAGDLSWLSETLGNAAGWVTAALLLGGIALVAMGACMGSLPMVLAGLLLIGAGVAVGTETGVFQSWVDTLGLNSVAEFVTIALMLAGIAFIAIGAVMGNTLMVVAGLSLLGIGVAFGTESGVLQSWVETLGLNSVAEFVVVAIMLAGVAIVAIGACTGNILMVIAGLALIGATIVYAEQSGMMESWTEEQLSKAASYVTAALLLGGIVLIAIGAVTANILMVLAGLGLLAAGVYVGVESGALQSWAEVLGLDSVFDYVVVAIQLAGIALIAVGAAMANIIMVIAGAVILAVGVTAQIIGEETLKNWWEVLKLTSVQQWVSVALLLIGIALVAIGACMGNILMIIAGMGILAVGTIVSASEGNLKDWVTVLGLQKAAGWVTAGLLIGGLALVIFGILTANIFMVLAGLGLLGAGIAVGVTSGTFSSWLDTIASAFKSFANTILEVFNGLWNGLKGIINGILGGIEWLANKVISGINTVIKALNSLSFTIPDWVPVLGGKKFGFNIKQLSEISIPRLATGAVIPPNREFLAVLGDQKSGNNIEAPESLIRKIVREEAGGNDNTALLQAILEALKAGQTIMVGETAFGRTAIKAINGVNMSAGKQLLLI